MRLPDDPTKFSRKWKYVEVARYVPDLDRVVRQQEYQSKEDREAKVPRTATMVSVEDLEAYADKYDRVGIYTSVFQFDKPNGNITDESARLGNLYFDLDDKENPDNALRDLHKLIDYFQEFVDWDAMRIYFTGLKGFHFEIEALAMGIGPSGNLPKVFRFIATELKKELDLTTLDFQVYDPRRMWRMPNTKHQKTGLYKRELFVSDVIDRMEPIIELAKEPSVRPVPEQIFDIKANEWFRDYLYRVELDEQPKYSSEELITRFKKSGSSVLKRSDGAYTKVFNPQTLLDGCPSILRLWEKAEKEHHLEHEERLFLLSILSYNEESLFYLFEILKNCSDFNPEKTQSHIDDWVKRREYGIGGKPYTCRTANEKGVGCGNCDLEQKHKWAKVGDHYIETDEYASPSPIRFAYNYKKE